MVWALYMADKSPKFLLAENYRVDPDGEYIVHSRDPVFVAKRVYDDPLTDFKIISGMGNISRVYGSDAHKIAALMRRLSDWYVSYVAWEENRMEE